MHGSQQAQVCDVCMGAGCVFACVVCVCMHVCVFLCASVRACVCVCGVFVFLSKVCLWSGYHGSITVMIGYIFTFSS